MEWTVEGSVYFACADGFDAIKIGWASDVHARMSQLAREARETVHCLATIPGDRRREQAIHRGLAFCRIAPANVPISVRTEWFDRESVAQWLSSHDVATNPQSFHASVRVGARSPQRAHRRPTDAGVAFAQWLVASGETHRSAAHRLGVSAALIGFWRSGVARPEHHYRVALERIVGIQVDDWMTDDEYQVAYGRPRLRVVGSG